MKYRLKIVWTFKTKKFKILQTETTEMDPQKLTTSEQCIQTDRVYYVTLPEQLDHISEQLTIN